MELSLINLLNPKLMDSIPYGWLLFTTLAVVLVLSISMAVIAKNAASFLASASSIKKGLTLSPGDYRKQLKGEADVTFVLKTVRQEFAADRVLLMQYHNGVRSIGNNHLLKISATHEVLGRTAKSMLNAIQQWPSNYLGDWNTAVFDNKYVEVLQTKEETTADSKGVYEYFTGYGVKDLYVFPVTDSYGDVFGVGIIHLSDKAPAPTPDKVKWASHRFHAIGALLAGVKEG